MTSSIVSRTSALVLAFAGLAMLFAADVVLPSIVPGFPPGAFWLGQLLAAAWFGVAVANWLQRTSVLGGVYGRPIVLANLALYFISALSLARALSGNAAAAWLWPAFLVAAMFAVAYATLLLRGPFGSAPHAAD